MQVSGLFLLGLRDTEESMASRLEGSDQLCCPLWCPGDPGLLGRWGETDAVSLPSAIAATMVAGQKIRWC